MIEHMTEALAVLRHAKRRLTVRLCIEVALYVVALTAAAVTIDIERAWWAITLCFIVAAFWQVAAALTLLKLVTIRREEVQLAGIVGGLDETLQALRAFGLPEEMLRKFSGPPPTTVTVDEEPPAATDQEATKA